MQDFEKHKANFFKFVDRIHNNDKVAIISHANCVDGLTSAVFMAEILKKKHPPMQAPHINFIAYGHGELDKFEKIFKKEGINKVFVLDFNADMDMFEEFGKFREEFDVFFIDHHPLNPELKLDEKVIKTINHDCTALVLYRLGEGLLDEKEWAWLACAAGVSEFSWKKEDNLLFIKKHYPDFKPFDESSELLKLTNNLGALVTYYVKDNIEAYHILLRKEFDKIEEINKEVSAEMQRCLDDFEKNAEPHFKKHLYFYFFKSRFSLGSKMSTIVSIRHKGSTIITFSDVEGTDLLKVSTRNNADELIYPMNEMLSTGVKGLEKAMGHGHPNASGGSFLKKDLPLFKKQILEFVKSRLS